MKTVTTTISALPPRLDLPPDAGGGFLGAVRSEWTKLRTVASTWWTLAAATTLLLGGMAIAAVSTRSQHADGNPAAFTSSAPFITGEVMAYLVQWSIVILSVLMVTAEYQSGSIRNTLQWVPDRARMLLSKVAVLVPLLLVLGMVFGAVGLGIAILGLGEFGEAFTTDDAYNVVVGVALYLPMLGVFALGLAAALRGAAQTISIIFVVLLILPLMLPAIGLETVAAYLPGDAGVNLMRGTSHPIYPRPVGGLIVLAWSLTSLATGYLALRKRDT
ncbi:ABC-2 type transport system permease protein [Actinokineospora alba]|uniref:ABC-2 type transport system permease protein n=1 Tax=Actinokineospora alba TaxID=504798 RepID=A0A1H0W1B9_9PSEU|nr:ABC-2 type transport system permease protein [Actinokineospora alba]SDI71331.1 ABC-2 type transport system permease protein [Actinokineospora alba]SDP84482.1 ABC-2 type transport system permease protein [Actinokineospora alba]